MNNDNLNSEKNEEITGAVERRSPNVTEGAAVPFGTAPIAGVDTGSPEIDKFFQEQQKINQYFEQPANKVFQREGDRSSGLSHGPDARPRANPTPKAQKPKRCNHCRELGHTQRECPKRGINVKNALPNQLRDLVSQNDGLRDALKDASNDKKEKEALERKQKEENDNAARHQKKLDIMARDRQLAAEFFNKVYTRVSWLCDVSEYAHRCILADHASRGIPCKIRPSVTKRCLYYSSPERVNLFWQKITTILMWIMFAIKWSLVIYLAMFVLTMFFFNVNTFPYRFQFFHVDMVFKEKLDLMLFIMIEFIFAFMTGRMPFTNTFHRPVIYIAIYFVMMLYLMYEYLQYSYGLLPGYMYHDNGKFMLSAHIEGQYIETRTDDELITKDDRVDAMSFTDVKHHDPLLVRYRIQAHIILPDKRFWFAPPQTNQTHPSLVLSHNVASLELLAQMLSAPSLDPNKSDDEIRTLLKQIAARMYTSNVNRFGSSTNLVINETVTLAEIVVAHYKRLGQNLPRLPPAQTQ